MHPALTLLSLATLVPAPAPPIFEVPADGRIAATIAGRPVEIVSQPGMPVNLYISNRLARDLFGEDEAKVRAGGGFSLFSIGLPTSARIGPVTIHGKSKVAPVAIGSGEASDTRLFWHETDAYALGEVLAGPYALPYPVIRYILHPAQPGEVTTTLPLGGRNAWWLAATPVKLSGETVHFALAPHFPTTVLSAAAGRMVVSGHGGQLSGKPQPTLISHGVSRPARLLTLDRPLRIGALSIPAALVRTRDYGSIGKVADADAVDPSEDEILVTGKRKRSKPSYVAYIGADALARCSSITYDKPARLITLSCLPD